jgi:predicted membrane protein
MSRPTAARLIIGLACIAGALVWLAVMLLNISVSPDNLIEHGWPLPFVLLGAASLIKVMLHHKTFEGYLCSLALLAFGLFAFAKSFGLFGAIGYFQFFMLLIPAGLLGFGAALLFNPQSIAMRRSYRDASIDLDLSLNGTRGIGMTHPMGGRREVHRSSFISDMSIGQDYWELTDMTVSKFIGDTRLDLTKAKIPAGETRIIISHFIGDVKVFVPDDPDLDVRTTVSVMIGDMQIFNNNETGNHHKDQRRYNEAGEPALKRIHLIISMMIGDTHVQRIG